MLTQDGSDSLLVVSDTVTAPSISQEGMQLHYGVTFAPRFKTPNPDSIHKGGAGMSWVITLFFLLFIIVCLRYRRNTRYFALILNDIIEVRERPNAFSDTMRETSFLWLLNLLWCASLGIILYGWVSTPAIAFGSADAGKLLLCMGLAVGYTIFMTLAYTIVGNVFTDTGTTSMWVKGYLSTQGLSAVVICPLALLALGTPGGMHVWGIITLILFILSKILFIYKGFCIFFNKSTFWVLFLYYLCSLEIIPVILLYISAVRLG